MTFKTRILVGLIAAAFFAAGANAQDVKHYRFAHDQQLNSGYSVAYDIFSAKLKELSKGTMLVDHVADRREHLLVAERLDDVILAAEQEMQRHHAGLRRDRRGVR